MLPAQVRQPHIELRISRKVLPAQVRQPHIELQVNRKSELVKQHNANASNQTHIHKNVHCKRTPTLETEIVNRGHSKHKYTDGQVHLEGICPNTTTAQVKTLKHHKNIEPTALPPTQQIYMHIDA